MKFIQIPLPPNLPKKWNLSCSARVSAVNSCATSKDRSDYIKKHGSWGSLKNWLAKANDFKCWYCEAKSHRAPFDVDHFRPKLGITIDGTKLAGHDGYWWIAYEWSNFRLSCQRCNRPEKDGVDVLHGKANEFPIRDESKRCILPSGQLDAESPRLLDPCVQDDCRQLAHGIDGEVKPFSTNGTWEYQRAQYTINRLGLNKWNTPELKKNSWRLLDDLIRLVGNHPTVLTHLQEHLSSDHEYSSFFRSAIGTHRDKAWIESLL